MGLFSKLKAAVKDDWCGDCSSKMDEIEKRLYLMPMSVGHYVDHKEAQYYIKNLIPINSKAEVPIGMYACRITVYRCPECQKRIAMVLPFLPVRDQERTEFAHYYKNGELDSFIRHNRVSDL